jgi:hypothetical protein
MRARLAVIIAIAFLMCGCVGSSKSRKDQMREQTKNFNEMADIMSTIIDRASCEAAKSKLKPYYVARFERQKKLREEEEQMSPVEKEQEAKELEKLKDDPDYEKSREAIKRYAHEMARTMSTPEIADLYMREIVGAASEPSNRP